MKTDRPGSFRPKRETISRTGTALATLLGMSAVGQLSYSATTTYQYDALGRLQSHRGLLQQPTSARSCRKPQNEAGQHGYTYADCLPANGDIIRDGARAQGKRSSDSNRRHQLHDRHGHFLRWCDSNCNCQRGQWRCDANSLRSVGGTPCDYRGEPDGGSTAPNSVTLQINILNIDWLPSVLQLLLQ